MGDTTIIGWTDHTQNFWKGCHPIIGKNPERSGCLHCYAEAAFKRAGWDFNQVTRTKTWGDPDKWQKRLSGTNEYELVFTCSWSDFWLPDADAWRPEAYQIIKRCPNLLWQVLTKRPGLIPHRLPPDWFASRCNKCLRRMMGTTAHDGACACGGLIESTLNYPNVWLGVSVETKDELWRISELKKVPATVHFLSLEPLLEDVAPYLEPYLDDIEWGIVGGESGNGTPNFRPMDIQWARNVRDLFAARKIPFFFKQSAANRTEKGTTIDGETVREYPPLPKGGIRAAGPKQLPTLGRLFSWLF
jgi:protein gp37